MFNGEDKCVTTGESCPLEKPIGVPGAEYSLFDVQQRVSRRGWDMLASHGLEKKRKRMKAPKVFS